MRNDIQIGEDPPLPSHLVQANDDSNNGQPHSSLVYLSAESSHVLETFSPNTTYVIGGLVDKNRHKGHCYSVAQKANIATARLPIDEYVKLNTKRVLTTNHVVEIVLKYLETGNWAESFLHVIPQRKGVGRKEDEAEDDGEEEDDEAELAKSGNEKTVDKVEQKPT
jgi:tRNA (guanine9-N1)-methyltransferase